MRWRRRAENNTIVLGYRYFFVDYEKNGVTYDAAQSARFTALGEKL
jgi:hypothetical protein